MWAFNLIYEDKIVCWLCYSCWKSDLKTFEVQKQRSGWWGVGCGGWEAFGELKAHQMSVGPMVYELSDGGQHHSVCAGDASVRRAID